MNEGKLRRGPGRPPGKKKFSIATTKRQNDDEGGLDDQISKRRRTMPTRLMDTSQSVESAVQYQSLELDRSNKSGNGMSQSDLILIKRPRGRPPLSANRGRVVPRAGRGIIKASSIKGQHFGNFGDTHQSKSSTSIDNKQSDVVCQLTRRIISWLMTHDPQTIPEIARGLTDMTASYEQIQAILDILQVLGIISVTQVKSNSNASDTKSSTSRVSQKLYCMKGFAKGVDIDSIFNFSDILEDIEKKNKECEQMESRINSLETLSSSMYLLSPEERIKTFKSYLELQLESNPNLKEDILWNATINAVEESSTS